MAGLDQDTRDLLIRLDEKVTTILHNQEQSKAEIKDLSYRVRLLEDWRSELRGGTKGVSAAWKIGMTLFGAFAGILAYAGVQMAIVPNGTAKPATTTASGKAHQ